MTDALHLDTGHPDAMHPYCGTYLGAGGRSTPIIGKATCYPCVKAAAERCAQRLYEIAFNRGRAEAAEDRATK